MTTSTDAIPVLTNISTVQGAVVAGKYRVEGMLHDGGRGLVVEATRMEDGSRVVLRLPGRRSCLPAETLPTFRNAAQRAALLPGDRAERPVEAGHLETGEPFIVTPLLEGIDLATKLQRTGALGPLDAVDIAIQACEAMADAHDKGVLHCDLRPEKLFLGTRDNAPFVTVLMSIISVLHDPDDPAWTPFDLTRRTDVYSLGMTLCVLLAGKPPYWERTYTSPSGRTCLSREYIPLSITFPDLSSSLASVIERAFSENPDDRYDSMVSFALALEPFAPARSHDVLARIASRPARKS